MFELGTLNRGTGDETRTLKAAAALSVLRSRDDESRPVDESTYGVAVRAFATPGVEYVSQGAFSGTCPMLGLA